MESGRLSRRMRVALDHALLAGGGSPAQEQRERNDELAGRLEAVEGQVETLGQDMNQGLASVHGEVRGLRTEHDEGMRRLARLESDGGVQEEEEESGDSSQRKGKPRLGREHSELATLEPADDDEDVFGNAWPLIQEWRELKDTHPDRGVGLDWLVVEEERFLTVELELLEKHGLTLPPETYPLRGLDRGNQVNWRRKASVATRRARRRLELLRWLRRVFTLGFLRK